MEAYHKKVHHAIIDLFEIHDCEYVDRETIATFLGMSTMTVQESLDYLEDRGSIAFNGPEIVYAENNGYFPTTR